MLTPYERWLMASLRKQPDQVPIAMGPQRLIGVPELEPIVGIARGRDLDVPKMDEEAKQALKKSVEADAKRARYYYGRWPDACGGRSVGTGGHGHSSIHIAQVLGRRLGRNVVFKESNRGGYAYTKPLIKNLSDFDVAKLSIPDLQREPAMQRVLEELGARLRFEDEAYVGLENNMGSGGGASTRCVEDIVDQGLLEYSDFLIGLRLHTAKIHKLCDLIADYVIETLKLHEEVMGKITKLSIADHCTTFMSKRQAEEFWVPYVSKVNKAFNGAIHIYHNEGYIIHLCDLIPKAGFDSWQIGPEDDLDEVRKIVGYNLSLSGNIDPVNILPFGSPQEVEEACKVAIEKGARDGAFILSTGGGGPRSGIPVKNFEAMYEACKKYGKYPIPS